MKRASRYLAGMACALASSHVAAMTPDPTGLWYDPAESGWGLTVAQQGETAFAVLFVYDSAHHPVWYVASDLVTEETFGPVPGAGPGFSGTLYRTMGPWFGGTFDPHAVTVTPVGSLTLHYTNQDRQSLRLDYVIDGTAVTKTLLPQTWVDDGGAHLTGGYDGGLWIPTKSATTCPDLRLGPFDAMRGFTFGVTVPTPGQLRFLWGTGSDTFCQVDGQYTQRGQLGSFIGNLKCGSINGEPEQQPGTQIQLSELAITPFGFAGAATLQIQSCTYTGHIGGVRLPD